MGIEDQIEYSDSQLSRKALDRQEVNFSGLYRLFLTKYHTNTIWIV